MSKPYTIYYKYTNILNNISPFIYKKENYILYVYIKAKRIWVRSGYKYIRNGLKRISKKDLFLEML